MKRIVLIVLSLITAFTLLSAGYALWGKKLIIKGNFTVVKAEPDFETGIIKKEVIAEDPAGQDATQDTGEPADMEGAEESPATDNAGVPNSTEGSEEPDTAGKTEDSTDETGIVETLQDAAGDPASDPGRMEEDEKTEESTGKTDDQGQAAENSPQENVPSEP